MKDYMVIIVFATRDPRAFGLADLAPLIEYGASPRATIFLTLAARAHAFLRRRAFVTPEDVKAVGLRRAAPPGHAHLRGRGRGGHARRRWSPACSTGSRSPERRRGTPPPSPSAAPMNTRELIQRIRRIEITTRRAVEDSLGGQYHSVFKGRGMDFHEVRAYAPGDEVRTIDWNVTARTGQLHVKRFVEERELTVMVLCDLSASTDFGSGARTKAEVAAEIAALLAFSAVQNDDRVGLCLFTDEVEKFVPPRKGRRHALRLVSEILRFQPRSRRTDLGAALDPAAADHAEALRGLRPLRLPRRRGPLRAAAARRRRASTTWCRSGSRTGWSGRCRRPGWRCSRIPRPAPRCGSTSPTGACATRLSTQADAAERRLTRLFSRLDLDHARVQADDADYVGPLLAFFQARARRHG